MLPFQPNFRLRSVASLLACLFWLVACGGVDSGGTGSFASGPITGFGSVIVGGVRYDDSEAAITDDFDLPSTSSHLRLGMVTEIRASTTGLASGVPTAKAMSVRYRSEIVGPVDQVDVAGATLVVLGQRVKVGVRTAFDPSLVGGLKALKVGDVVEVFGQLDVAANRYVATLVAPRADAVSYKLRGRVGAIDVTTHTLTVGGLAIDTAGVAQLPALSVGQKVRVLLQTTPQGGTWIATAVEPSPSMLPDRSVAELDGRITSFVSVRQFSIDGFAVVTNGATQFPNGTAGLVLGARVEVKGSTGNGVLTASRVALENEDEADAEGFELSGLIGSLDTTAKTFAIRGVTVSYATTLRFEGGLASDLPRASRAEVRGKLSSDGTRLDATSIHLAF